MKVSLMCLLVFGLGCMGANGNNVNFYVLKYTLIKTPMTVVQARSACAKLGMKLVKIETQAEMTYIKLILVAAKTTDKTRVWTDGVRSGSAFAWHSNGQSIKYSDWASGEPNNLQHNENCVEMRSAKQWKWNDAPCTYKKYPLCEKSSGWTKVKTA